MVKSKLSKHIQSASSTFSTSEQAAENVATSFAEEESSDQVEHQNDEDNANSEMESQTSFSSQYANADALVGLLTKMAAQGDGDIKVRSPDKFNGSDRTKLRPFLAQCRMVFLSNPQKFRKERSKVLFAASYFDGIALSWWEPILFMQDKDNVEFPPFMDSFNQFETELTKLFGDPDSERTAENKINSLKMKEHQQVSKYITIFRQYQMQLHWDERALMYSFRKGLPSRILDELSRKDERPKSLIELQQSALQIDLRYWERHQERKEFAEKDLKEKDKFSFPTRTHLKTSSNNFQRNSQISSSSSNNFSPSASLFSSSSNGNRSLTTSRNYAHIGPDGKISEEEKERRKKMNLCLYCGGEGHLIDKCPKKMTNFFKSGSKSKISTIKSVGVEVDKRVSSISPPAPNSPQSPTIRATFTLSEPVSKKE